MINFYVNTDTGDNNNDGKTPKTAWKSQEYASYKLSYVVGEEVIDLEDGKQEIVTGGGKLSEPVTINCSGTARDIGHVSYDAIKTDLDKELFVLCTPEYVLEGAKNRHALVIKNKFFNYQGGTIDGSECGEEAPICIGKFPNEEPSKASQIFIQSLLIPSPDCVDIVKVTNPLITPVIVISGL